MRKRNFMLFGAPAALLVGAMAWAAFAAVSAASADSLKPSGQTDVARQEAKNGTSEDLGLASVTVYELDQVLGSTSVESYADSSVSCSVLDREITSELGFFTYDSRMRAMANVSSQRQAESWFNSNFTWAFPIGISDRYADRSTDYLAETLKDSFEDDLKGKRVDWGSLGMQLKSTALERCGLEGVYEESSVALQRMDAEVARMIDLYLGN